MDPIHSLPGRGPDRDHLRASALRIAAAPLRSVRGVFCRAVRAVYLERSPPEPLYFRGSADFGARYTPLGGPAGLYLASDQATAFAEIRDLVYGPAGTPLPLEAREPVTLVYVRTEVAGVLDLTDAVTRGALGLSLAELSGEWRDGMEAFVAGHGPLPPTQRVGAAAHLTGRVRAILFPSVRCRGGVCLVAFPDRLRTGEDLLEVADRQGGRYAQRLPAAGAE